MFIRLDGSLDMFDVAPNIVNDLGVRLVFRKGCMVFGRNFDIVRLDRNFDIVRVERNFDIVRLDRNLRVNVGRITRCMDNYGTRPQHCIHRGQRK
jgi:hypothetical protein